MYIDSYTIFYSRCDVLISFFFLSINYTTVVLNIQTNFKLKKIDDCIKDFLYFNLDSIYITFYLHFLCFQNGPYKISHNKISTDPKSPFHLKIYALTNTEAVRRVYCFLRPIKVTSIKQTKQPVVLITSLLWRTNLL